MGHSATYFRNAGTSSIFLLDELKKKKKKKKTLVSFPPSRYFMYCEI